MATYLPPEAPHEGSSFDLAAHGRAAVVVDVSGTEWIVDAEHGAQALRRELPARMLQLIEAGPDAVDTLREVERAAARGRLRSQPLGDGQSSFPAELVRLLAPLPDPPSLRDFYAFEQHVRKGFERRGEEIPAPWFELPVYYKGNHRSILGPGETIPWPSFTDELDYELELAMIVGRRGRDLTVAQAHEHIFGYTLMNDISARDLQ
ncbi:MAG TPA: fumarylacetoacetate hydrolase family protein, partial [Nitriliruptorales bacterium]